MIFCSWAIACQRTKWAWQGLTEIKSRCRHVHTQKSLWKMCCLSLHEWTQQLKHLAKLQWEERSTARDIPRCPLTVSLGRGERCAWLPGPRRADGKIPGCVRKQTAIKQTANEDATWPSAECLPKDRGAARGREGLCRQKLQAQGDFFKRATKKSLGTLLVIKVTHEITQSKHCFEGKRSLLNKELYTAERIPF